jgi:prepilin signal peptidase PulO-like enzyme (type II secretory pathway)
MNLFVFLFGLIVGSFLNCVIYRLEQKQSFLQGRSFCPHCKHTLSWQDLIPVFSFLFLKGKCQYCNKKISIQYPLVEIATGILFLLILNFKFLIFNEFLIFNFETITYFLYLLIISSLLIIVFVYDLKHFIIPDKVIFPAIIIALGFRVWDLVGHWSLEFGIFHPFIAAFGASGFFLFIVLVSRGKWMGVGDIKLAFLMGLLLGFPYILVALFFSFLIGAIIGIGLILAKRKTMKSEVPFGPFLVIGTFIALFLGEIIINWYWNLFI